MSLPSNYPNFPNKAHQRAYLDGILAAQNGSERFAPYGAENRSSLHFRRAWLAGYDGRTEAALSPPGRAEGED